MINVEKIIGQHYNSSTELYRTLIVHSRCVAQKAIEIAIKSGIDNIDLQFVEEASMLHDIGVYRCNAPSIYCNGEEPYICHGRIGREILEQYGLMRHALVCERHTGAGLTIEDIVNQNLPLPHRDMLPITIEEKLICYADKFFSKSGNIKHEKKIDEVKKMMLRHGEKVYDRFIQLHKMFNLG